MSILFLIALAGMILSGFVLIFSEDERKIKIAHFIAIASFPTMVIALLLSQ